MPTDKDDDDLDRQIRDGAVATARTKLIVWVVIIAVSAAVIVGTTQTGSPTSLAEAESNLMMAKLRMIFWIGLGLGSAMAARAWRAYRTAKQSYGGQ